MMLMPATLDELTDVVRSAPRLLAIGAGTKPALSAVEAAKVSLRRLSGIIEYEPSEFTFTALAGTPLRELKSALAERGQYLPFDPLLAEAGATLGGTVASGLSGPGRFRYGGLRDFILGVRFVDGMGRMLRLGGKVVKNAAGFDVPKFLVGSLGRFGVLAEVTFKVFPKPVASRTLTLSFHQTQDAVAMMTEAANARWEVDALDLLPDGKTVLLRLTGPVAALEAISREILARWPGAEAPDEVWTAITEFRWAAADDVLMKVPLTSDQIVPLRNAFPDARVHVSAGGNVAYIALPEAPKECRWPALTLRGAAPLWHAPPAPSQILHAVKAALDPRGRFPSLEN